MNHIPGPLVTGIRLLVSSDVIFRLKLKYEPYLTPYIAFLNDTCVVF